MGKSSKEKFKILRQMGLVVWNMLMDRIMKGILEKICLMARVKMVNLMDLIMKETFHVGRKVGKVSFISEKVECTKDNFVTIFFTVEGFLF